MGWCTNQLSHTSLKVFSLALFLGIHFPPTLAWCRKQPACSFWLSMKTSHKPFSFQKFNCWSSWRKKRWQKVANTGNLRRFRVLGLSPCVQKLLVKGAWCLSRLIRRGLSWLRCQIWDYFFKAWMVLKVMFWSTYLTWDTKKALSGNLGLRTDLLNEMMGWEWKEEQMWAVLQG